MKALDILFNKTFEVEKYKKCYFKLSELKENGKYFLGLTHEIYYQSNKEPTLENTQRYGLYLIDGKTYERILTSNLTSKDFPQKLMDEYSEKIIQPKVKQLSLFDEYEEEFE